MDAFWAGHDGCGDDACLNCEDDVAKAQRLVLACLEAIGEREEADS
jgi:hypothetical protein